MEIFGRDLVATSGASGEAGEQGLPPLATLPPAQGPAVGRSVGRASVGSKFSHARGLVLGCIEAKFCKKICV